VQAATTTVSRTAEVTRMGSEDMATP